MENENNGNSYIVIGTFGTVQKDFKRKLENIGIETKIDEFQKSVILNMARILRKVLESYRLLFLGHRSLIKKITQ